MENKEDRKTGRTTRLVNYYIEKLFKNGSVIIRDHENQRSTHADCFNRVLKRLKSEHNLLTLSSKGVFKVDTINYIIKWDKDGGL